MTDAEIQRSNRRDLAERDAIERRGLRPLADAFYALVGVMAVASALWALAGWLWGMIR